MVSRSKFALLFLFGVSLAFAVLTARQFYLSKGLPRAEFDQKKLKVLTYTTFAGATGPGKELIDAFKNKYKAEVEVQVVDNSGLLIERARLSEQSSPFDVVIGLDQFQLEDAKVKLQWRELPASKGNLDPRILAYIKDPRFAPFDWSPMTFIYRQGTNAPKKFDDLLDKRFSNQIALQDPHMSSPGLQFLNWVQMVQSKKSPEFLSSLAPNVASVAPSWSFSYGLFKKKEVALVFSYLTSLAFHWEFEKDRSYQAVELPEGHPIQVEFAGVLKSCRQCELGEQFVLSMSEPESQKLIMQKNFMLPVLAGVTDGTIYEQLPKLKVLSESTHQGTDFSAWDKVFKH